MYKPQLLQHGMGIVVSVNWTKWNRGLLSCLQRSQRMTQVETHVMNVTEPRVCLLWWLSCQDMLNDVGLSPTPNSCFWGWWLALQPVFPCTSVEMAWMWNAGLRLGLLYASHQLKWSGDSHNEPRGYLSRHITDRWRGVHRVTIYAWAFCLVTLLMP